MTKTSNSASTSHYFSLAKRMLAGAGTGLLLISLFLLSADEPNPAWGKLWMIRPLVVVPFAGAMGGLCQHIILHIHQQVGVSRTVAIVFSVVVFIIGLFVGFVLGLDGTMWN